MTPSEFASQHRKFVALFDEVASFSEHLDRKQLEFLRNVVRVAQGVCILSGTNSMSPIMIAEGASHQEREMRICWAVLWLKFPPATRKTVELRHENLSNLTPSWSLFLDAMLEKFTNRPWFINLLVGGLNKHFIDKFPTFCESGLRALCRNAYDEILYAKLTKRTEVHTGQFVAGQLKLLYAAYAQNRALDWTLTSHFTHVKVSGCAEDALSVDLYVGDGKVQPIVPKVNWQLLNEYTSSPPASSSASPSSSSPFSSSSSSATDVSEQKQYYDLCEAANCNLVLENKQPFRPCAVFPPAAQEPLLYLFCADEPFIYSHSKEENGEEKWESHSLSSVLMNPVRPGVSFPPAKQHAPTNSNPKVKGSDSNALGALAAAMCIASHRCDDAFACPPYVFLKNVVKELLGPVFSSFPEPSLLKEFVGALKVPYVMPANRGSFAISDTDDSYEITMGTLERVENSERFDITLQHPNKDFLAVSGECKDWQHSPPLPELLQRAPKNQTKKWLRIVFCQKGPCEPTTETDISHLVIAKLGLSHTKTIELTQLKVTFQNPKRVAPQARNAKEAEGMFLFLPLRDLGAPEPLDADLPTSSQLDASPTTSKRKEIEALPATPKKQKFIQDFFQPAANSS